MSRAPPAVLDECPLSRAFDLFLHENLRHLPVVNGDSKVVGIITRHDLVDVQHHPAQYERYAKERHLDMSVLLAQADAANKNFLVKKETEHQEYSPRGRTRSDEVSPRAAR